MKQYEILKPEGTFYSDYLIVDSIVYAIFEFYNKVQHIKVCTTDKKRADIIEETDTHLIITI